MNKNSKWYAGALVLVGVVVGVALVSAGTSVVHWSGSTQFCGTFCHSMDAAYASYQKGQHAATHSGFKAECVDCHLKYESVHSISQAQVVGLLWHKAVSGTNSLIGEITGAAGPAAVLMAIENAIGGAEINEYPATPDKILNALGKAKGGLVE